MGAAYEGNMRKITGKLQEIEENSGEESGTYYE